MKHLLATTLFLLALLTGAICPAVDVPRFQAGDRWCVLGDSITDGGSYHKYVELFYLTRFPTQPLDVINCGISGDTAPGSLPRVNWDCLDAHPTVVSVMLGMNDVGRWLYEQGANYPDKEAQAAKIAATYDQAMRALTKALLDSGAKVILIKPSIFDDTADLPKPNNPGCGAALAGFAQRVQAIADEYKIPTVDFTGPMTAINAEQQKRDPHFTIVGPDRVHPKEPGHLVMAYEMLHAQKPSGIVSRITIDAAAGKAGPLEHCEVTNLEAATNAVVFTCLEGALPFPVEAAAKPALNYVPFTQELNQEILLVRGLAPGEYALGIDGEKVRAFTAAELADGVNLAAETNTPQIQQAFAVRAALQKKWTAADKLRAIAYGEHYAWPDAKHPVDFAQMPAKLDARLAKIGGTNSPDRWLVMRHKNYLEFKPHEAELHRDVNDAVRAARAAAVPKPHQFTLRPAAGETQSDNQGKSGDSLPQATAGFGGVIHGSVKEVKPDGTSFRVTVTEVEPNASLNKAAKPAALVGSSVLIGPRWIKNGDGQFVIAQEDLDFIKELTAGQEITITAVNWNVNAARLDLNWYEGAKTGGQLTPARSGR